MKHKDLIDGMLLSDVRTNGVYEFITLATRGTVVVDSYYSGHRHYINSGKLVPLDIRIEPDEDGFHAYIPSLKGCHTSGESREQAFINLKDAARAYIRSARKHGDLQIKRGY